MLLDSQRCYQALKAHDTRFDGRFFVGVSSTRIYCRPVCTVRTPKQENCRFFASAAAAESAGYRPCLRCRPELAPGNASIDASTRLAHFAASLIEEGLLTGRYRPACIASGSDRPTSSPVFQAEFGVSPIEFERIASTGQTVADRYRLASHRGGYGHGFASLRRFNALFRERYRLSPSDLRKAVNGSQPADMLGFQLGFRPPLDWKALLSSSARERSTAWSMSMMPCTFGQCASSKVERRMPDGWPPRSPNATRRTN
jgi:AraC family transcriptional regulator of adaptative response / DNA-3-methyladenine glycosylase II